MKITIPYLIYNFLQTTRISMTDATDKKNPASTHVHPNDRTIAPKQDLKNMPDFSV
jgi:hypothetical protein